VILAARKLTVDAGARRLITELSLDLPSGQLLAVLGKNGTGKSLLLQTLAGLRAASGSIRLGGDSLAELTRRQVAARLGLLPQDSTAPLAGTVRDWVMLGEFARQGWLARPRSDLGSRVNAVLQSHDLESLATQEASTLSGGERRRAEMALLALQAAPLWLLDEPTNHLDPAQQLRIIGLLRAHCAAGGAAVVSLHDPALASLAHQVLLLHGDGRWQCGPAKDFLRSDTLAELYGAALTQALLPSGQRIFVATGDLP
jgi:iron complex transport system ATP-binding protein